VTVESVAPILAANPRGVILARDELAAWIGGFDKFHGGRGEEVHQWMEMHRAGRVTVDRKTGDRRTVHVQRASLCVAGTIQPGVLERVLGQRHFDNGLAARLLLAWPPGTLRQWNESEIEESLLLRVRRVFQRLISVEMPEDPHGCPAPQDICMSQAAKTSWIAFFEKNAAETHGTTDARLRSAFSKLEGAAARLALVLHCARVAALDLALPVAGQIEEEDIDRGVRLTEWFKRETRRIYGRLTESEDVRDSRKVLECIRAHNGRVTVRDVVKSGLCRSDAERVEYVLNGLAAAGHGLWREKEPGREGGRRTRYFELIADAAGPRTETAGRTDVPSVPAASG
jgi:hypothetical protein